MQVTFSRLVSVFTPFPPLYLISRYRKFERHFHCEKQKSKSGPTITKIISFWEKNNNIQYMESIYAILLRSCWFYISKQIRNKLQVEDKKKRKKKWPLSGLNFGRVVSKCTQYSWMARGGRQNTICRESPAQLSLLVSLWKLWRKKKSDLKLHAQRWRHVWPIPQSTTRGQITIRCEGYVCGLYRADSMFSFTRPWGVGQDSDERLNAVMSSLLLVRQKYAVTGMGCRQRGLYITFVSLCMGVCMCFSAIDTEQEW